MESQFFSKATLFTVFFLAYSLLEVTGLLPQEVRSAGLALPSIFSRFYGQESLDFVGYHIRRTAVTIVIHCSLPFAYTIGLWLITLDPDDVAPPTILRLLVVSLCILLAGVGLAWHWSRYRWSYHPLSRTLAEYDTSWRHAASLVNVEMRHFDNFKSTVGCNEFVVSESWIVLCRLHSLSLIKQTDAELSVSTSDEQRMELEGRQVQFLNVKVTSNNQRIPSFTVRMKSSDYSHLREKLSSPLTVARNIVIRQTLTDQFLTAFTEQMDVNGTYHIPTGSPPLDLCLGCGQKMPEVKLKKMCSAPEEGECRDCQCHPMWCIGCMCRWFASRQDQTRPYTWMASSATCPMCRQPFCMLDVLRIER